MTTPGGVVSIGDVRAELGQSGASFSVDRADVRALCQRPGAGTIFSSNSWRFRTCETKAVGIGGPFTQKGYNFVSGGGAGDYGTCTPNTLEGQLIRQIILPSPGGGLQVTVDNLLNQSSFYAVGLRNPGVAVNGSLPTVILFTSAASFSATTSGVWTWGSSPGINWDAGGTTQVQFYY